MGKAKEIARAHDEAIMHIVQGLSDLWEYAKCHPVSVAEFVGNLRATEHLVLTESHARADGQADEREDAFESFVDELIAAIREGE